MLTEVQANIELETILFWFMNIAVAVSAISGVLIAGKNRFDLFGMVTIALVTALGGGSLRDMLLNIDVFWIQNQLFLVVAFCSGIAAFFYARRYSFSLEVFLIPDAIGLAAFSIAGTMKALSYGTPWLAASFMGVITGVLGGMLRDIICNETPIVFKGTLYATASWLGGLMLIILINFNINITFSSAIAGLTIFLIRMTAIKWRLGLPVFQFKET